MNIFDRDPAGSVTRSIRNTIRKTIRGLVLSGGLVGGLVLLAGCPNSGSKEKPKPTSVTPAPAPTPTPGGGGNTGAPSEPKIIVGDPPLSITLNENGAETLVDLPYRGQEGAVPTSCEVSSPLMVTVTKPCACLEGVCRVGVQPTPKIFGDGSFEFRLSGQSGQKEISSNTGKASVRVLEVTLSISSGDKQGGIVGTNLSAPIVVLVQNSDKVPVSGVKIFWSIERRFNWKEEWTGKTSSCTEETDEHGLAQCVWTLGNAVIASGKKVDASAFYSFKEIYRKTLGVSFSASVKPDTIAKLSFWSDAMSLPSSIGMYRGPAAWWRPIGRLKETAGVPLGRPSDGGEWGLWVFAQDKYGNSATVSENGVDVTLSFKENPSGGEVPSGNFTIKMVNCNLKVGDEDDDIYEWMQGVAKFKDLRVYKVGKYVLGASGPTGLELKSSTDEDYFDAFPGAAAKLAFTTQPGGAVHEVALSPQPAVAVQDPHGNTVSDTDPFSAAKIELAISTGTGTPGAALKPIDGLSVTAIKGVATFTGLSIDKLGNDYKLTASSKDLELATSSTFNIQ